MAKWMLTVVLCLCIHLPSLGQSPTFAVYKSEYENSVAIATMTVQTVAAGTTNDLQPREADFEFEKGVSASMLRTAKYRLDLAQEQRITPALDKQLAAVVTGYDALLAVVHALDGYIDTREPFFLSQAKSQLAIAQASKNQIQTWASPAKN